ncbi:unnamed protein product [Lampetra planeri]
MGGTEGQMHRHALARNYNEAVAATAAHEDAPAPVTRSVLPGERCWGTRHTDGDSEETHARARALHDEEEEDAPSVRCETSDVEPNGTRYSRETRATVTRAAAAAAALERREGEGRVSLSRDRPGTSGPSACGVLVATQRAAATRFVLLGLPPVPQSHALAPSGTREQTEGGLRCCYDFRRRLLRVDETYRDDDYDDDDDDDDDYGNEYEDDYDDYEDHYDDDFGNDDDDDVDDYDND